MFGAITSGFCQGAHAGAMNNLGYRAVNQGLNDRVDQTAQKVGLGNAQERIKPLGASGSVKGGIEWGGKEGPKASGSVSIEVKDKSGNGVQAEIVQNSDGTGSATISATVEAKK